MGDAYFRLGRLDEAGKVYGDLVDSNLTTEERRRSRRVYLNLSRIHAGESRGDLAYQDLREFRALGGNLPTEYRVEYGGLAASFANYLPLGSIESWSYASTQQDYSVTVTVDQREPSGSYRIERHESGRVRTERWAREGSFVDQRSGPDGAIVTRIPVNVDAVESTLPFVEYRTGPDDRLLVTAEIVATNRTVELSDGTEHFGCLQVRVTRTAQLESGQSPKTRYVIYLAPELGEIKRQVFRGDQLVEELELARVVRQDESTLR